MKSLETQESYSGLCAELTYFFFFFFKLYIIVLVLELTYFYFLKFLRQTLRDSLTPFSGRCVRDSKKISKKMIMNDYQGESTLVKPSLQPTKTNINSTIHVS